MVTDFQPWLGAGEGGSFSAYLSAHYCFPSWLGAKGGEDFFGLHITPNFLWLGAGEGWTVAFLDQMVHLPLSPWLGASGRRDPWLQTFLPARSWGGGGGSLRWFLPRLLEGKFLFSPLAGRQGGSCFCYTPRLTFSLPTGSVLRWKEGGEGFRIHVG